MISESSYWKNDLLKQAASLRLRQDQRRWPEASFSRVEQLVMLGFYSIRKLIEAKKLSDSTVTSTVQLRAYGATGKSVTLMNWHNVDKLFDLENARLVTLDVVGLCHQFVHSYVFMVVLKQSGGLGGFLLSSDRQRRRLLYEIDVGQVITLFEQVGKDYPASVSMQFNETTQDFDVTASAAVESP
jgi:hypothetical protein